MASSSTRSSELQHHIDEIQSRLRKSIETARPAHEANLRAAQLNPSPAAAPKSAPADAAKPPDAQPEAATRRTKRPRRRSASNPNEPEPNSPLERHSRKCKICNHRERDLIEADFIQWRHPGDITSTYKIAYDALYRHATATGLSALRRENVSVVVQKVLEEVESVQEPSAAAILRAVRTLACLDSRGRWAEPPTTHVVVNTTAAPAESANPTTSSDAPALLNSSPVSSSTEPQAPNVQSSNRKIYEKLEPEVTHT
jgi:hypothetical protein